MKIDIFFPGFFLIRCRDFLVLLVFFGPGDFFGFNGRRDGQQFLFIIF